MSHLLDVQYLSELSDDIEARYPERFIYEVKHKATEKISILRVLDSLMLSGERGISEDRSMSIFFQREVLIH